MELNAIGEWVNSVTGGGGAAMLVVFFVFFVGLCVTLYELLAGSRRAVIPPATRVHVFEHLKHDRRSQALAMAQEKRSAFAEIVKTALRLPEDTPSYITYSAIEDALFEETAVLRGRVALLHGLGVLALLAGLAGAIGGLYRGLSAEGIQTAAMVARSVANALPAAAAGVIVSIVLLTFGFLFQLRLGGNEAALAGNSSRLAAYMLGPSYVERALPSGEDQEEEEEDQEEYEEEDGDEDEDEEEDVEDA